MPLSDDPLLALGDTTFDPDLPDNPAKDPDAPLCPNEDLDACACSEAGSVDTLLGAWLSPLFESRRASGKLSACRAILSSPYPMEL